VLQGEQIPTEEKVYSIFEPHTDLIKRGKARKTVEFGHKVFLAESAQGLITDYQVLDGNPSDTNHVQPSLDRHQQTFGNPPDLYATDRGFFSAENVQSCEKAESPKFRSRSAEDTRRPSRMLWSVVKRSRRPNDSAPALRAASPCCSAAAG